MVKITLSNIRAYITGHYRYKLYHTPHLRGLMRTHIKEQIATRIRSMDKLCFDRGSCKLCGCRTTHLQMANKACDKPCYPKLVDSYQWLTMKRGFSFKFKGITWRLVDDKFRKL